MGRRKPESRSRWLLSVFGENDGFSPKAYIRAIRPRRHHGNLETSTSSHRMASLSGDTAHCGGLKRHRKSHAKVKTGCLTCKIRRKKCDETYPACVRCTSTGRKCDGYANRLPSLAASAACRKRRKLATPTQLPTPPGSDEVDIESLSGWSDDGLQRGATEPVIPTDKGGVDANAVQFSEVEDWSDLETLTWRGANTKSQSITLGHSIPEYCFRVTTSESLQPTSLRVESPHRRWEAFPLQIYKAPFVKHFNSEREALCFHFFCERTGPEFSGFFDSSFWSGWLLRACTIHPAVQQAMIALGAVHRRRELGLTQEAFNYCELAIKSYTKAIKGLNQALTAKDAHSLELSVVVSVLFAAFETFQNNYADATKHMVAGLKILFDRKLKRISTTATTSRVIFNSKTLLDLIDRLEIMCDGFFESLLIIPEISLEDDEPLFPYVPNHFNTLEEARDVLVALVHQVLPLLYHDPRDRATRFRQHQDYVAVLFRWSCTYAEYFKQFKSSMSVSNSRAAMLLRVYREAAYLVLLVDKTTSPADALITQVEDPELHCDFSCHTHQNVER